jgi:Zn-dependent peptidase ImmA (M78 family)
MADLNEPHIVQAVAAANTTRSRLGIGPTGPVEQDLLDLTELGLAIPVTILPLPDGVAGAYQRKRRQSFIFIQANDFPTRQRFTLLHEIGHHVLGHTARVENEADIGSGAKDPNEQQANYFASEFLVPHAAAVAWMEANVPQGRDLTLEELVRAACAYHISPPAFLYRLTTSGLERGQSDRLWDRINAKEHITVEETLGLADGGDDAITRAWTRGDWPRLPRELADNARRAHAAGFIDRRRLDEVLRTEGSEPADAG